MTAPGTGLDGRAYLVTGSTRGIGLGIVDRLLAEGARVVVNGRDADAVRDVERTRGSSVAGIVGSIDQDEVVRACVDAAVDGFGRLDGIVNNVGVNAFHGPLTDIPRSRWDRTVALNLTAPLMVVQQAVARGFGADRRGVVVNMSTVGARQPQPGIGAYCTTKAGLEMLTKVLALELGPRGVRVNAVAPGLVATETSRKLWEGKAEELGRARPSGRLGEVRDVAAVTLFLLSDQSDWMTGSVVVVDGGALLVTGPAAATDAARAEMT